MPTTRNAAKPAAPAPRKPPLIIIPPEKRCAHLTTHGAPCRAARWRASRFCIFHDPNFRNMRKQLELRRNSSQGQKSTRTAEGIQDMLESAAQDVRENRISPAAGSTIGYLGQVMSSNLKNLPQAEGSSPRRVDTGEILGQWADQMLEDMNTEIARWVPASSPLAVAKAGMDPVKIAADASEAEAQAADSSAGRKDPNAA
ncbi:MAG: hypothetical protein HY234_04300 [Acidobacteria bacterium]|nr:hypothetical protein [Acidobacteriota bacterium]MBI3662258.1 hypothetical protein [Acidobacteriota bacterium]